MEGFQQPQEKTPEEKAEIQRQRTLSDAELLKDGAVYKEEGDGRMGLEPTKKQIMNAKIEMGEHFYKEYLKEKNKIGILNLDSGHYGIATEALELVDNKGNLVLIPEGSEIKMGQPYFDNIDAEGCAELKITTNKNNEPKSFTVYVPKKNLEEKMILIEK